MRQTKHITVAVPVDLYRQTRRLAAEYDTTVTALVAYLIERLPLHLKNAGVKPGQVRHRPVLSAKELAKLPAKIPSWLPAPTPSENAISPTGPAESAATPADSAASASA